MIAISIDRAHIGCWGEVLYRILLRVWNLGVSRIFTP